MFINNEDHNINNTMFKHKYIHICYSYVMLKQSVIHVFKHSIISVIHYVCYRVS